LVFSFEPLTCSSGMARIFSLSAFALPSLLAPSIESRGHFLSQSSSAGSLKKPRHGLDGLQIPLRVLDSEKLRHTTENCASQSKRQGNGRNQNFNYNLIEMENTPGFLGRGRSACRDHIFCHHKFFCTAFGGLGYMGISARLFLWPGSWEGGRPPDSFPNRRGFQERSNSAVSPRPLPDILAHAAFDMFCPRLKSGCKISVSCPSPQTAFSCEEIG